MARERTTRDNGARKKENRRTWDGSSTEVDVDDEDDAAVEVAVDDGGGGVLVEELQHTGTVQSDAQSRLP